MGDIRFIGRSLPLCGSCEVVGLEQEAQQTAVEVGKHIMASPELSAQYGRALLTLTLAHRLSQEQSSALIHCLRNNVNGLCFGLVEFDELQQD